MFLGYKAYHWLRVTLKHDDFKKLSAVVDAAVAGGTTSLSNLAWDMEDDTTLRAQALEKVTQRARIKAACMARGAGASLAGVYRVSDQYTRDWSNYDTILGLGSGAYAGRTFSSLSASPPAAPAEASGAAGFASAEAPAGAGPGVEPSAAPPPPPPPPPGPPSPANVPGKLRITCSVQAAFVLR